ncbi:hypothetical protein I7I53_07463 [Histoplasma capsulatum var. duboisii H88]|uniref:Uncharacterized protein n=1 Tax=Ajellomyces capsulatus (strain H88) TaxID=544711 RepID=A0A8A1LEK0_AJEC8|nr:hypothetical protein I7I53_07463 [Histoplasma capsulatum var. duboisii H88]
MEYINNRNGCCPPPAYLGLNTTFDRPHYYVLYQLPISAHAMRGTKCLTPNGRSPAQFFFFPNPVSSFPQAASCDYLSMRSLPCGCTACQCRSQGRVWSLTLSLSRNLPVTRQFTRMLDPYR